MIISRKQTKFSTINNRSIKEFDSLIIYVIFFVANMFEKESVENIFRIKENSKVKFSRIFLQMDKEQNCYLIEIFLKNYGNLNCGDIIVTDDKL